MELVVIGLISFIGVFIQVINLKFNYFRQEAICLDYSTGHYAFVSFPLYEYEIIEDGIKVIYKNEGTTLLYPKKGKKYKVLIHKRNYRKIVGYSEYIGNVVLLFILAVCLFFLISFM